MHDESHTVEKQYPEHDALLFHKMVDADYLYHARSVHDAIPPHLNPISKLLRKIDSGDAYSAWELGGGGGAGYNLQGAERKVF